MTDPWAALVADARRALPAHVFRYFSAGAREEVSVSEAEDSWAVWRLLPRVLRDVREPDLRTTVLGVERPTPLGIAPTSLQRLADPEGELAMARAAAQTQTLMVVSSNAGSLFSDIEATGVDWWLQAYVTADREVSVPVIDSAVAAGAQAIALTVDTPVVGTKYAIDDAAFGDVGEAYGRNHQVPGERSTPGSEHAADLVAADIERLARRTGLPVVVKGVLRGDEARRCVEAGASAVWVSNHGGRQLDRALSTAQALPAVVAAVGPDSEVYVDGGVHRGLDALVAVSLGARAVFCGRVPLYALSAGGQPRVRAELDRMASELVEALRLSGSPQLSDTQGLIAPARP